MSQRELQRDYIESELIKEITLRTKILWQLDSNITCIKMDRDGFDILREYKED